MGIKRKRFIPSKFAMKILLIAKKKKKVKTQSSCLLSQNLLSQYSVTTLRLISLAL